MRWLAILGGGLLWLGVAAPSRSSEVDVNALSADLRSNDPAVRLAAAKALASRPSLPESLAGPAIQYIRTEIARATERRPTPGARTSDDVALPDDPEAVTFAQIKAKPESFIGTRFILVGHLGRGTSYGYGYAQVGREYYSLNYRPHGPDEASQPRRRLYLLKFSGRKLIEQIARADQGKEQGQVLVRLLCTIDPERCDRPEDATSSVLVTDWQFLAGDGKSWTPWMYEGINAGFDVLFRTGGAATRRCIDLITSEDSDPNEDVDKALRAWTIIRIVGLPKTQREAIRRELPERALRARSAHAKVWATRAYNSLVVKRPAF